ncbi:unnamed protein product, partial [Vitis vinifera]
MKPPLRYVADPSPLVNEFANFCHQWDLHRAMRAMDAMERHGVFADAITYSELIKCCSARGAVQEGKRVHEHIFCKGYEPKMFVVNTLLNMYVKFNLLEEAEDLFDEMPERNVVSWTTMISAYSNKLNDKALKCLILMFREGVRPNMFTYSSVLRACDGLPNLRQLHCGIIKTGLESDVFVRSFESFQEDEESWKTMTNRGIRKTPGCSWIEVDKQIHVFILGDTSHPKIEEIVQRLNDLIERVMGVGYVPDTNFVLQDLEGEQKEDSLRYHSEKLAIMFGLMNLSREKTVRIRKNLRICGDCHVFAKVVSRMEHRSIVIRDPIRYHHFQDGVCSCGDYW